MDELILSIEQLRCLQSPLRAEVWDVVRANGSGTTRDVGKALGKSSESVHYHLKELHRCGLIRVAFKRPAPRKPEVVYEPVGVRVQLPKPTDPSIAATIRQSVGTRVRMVWRQYEQASERALRNPELREHMNVLQGNFKLSRDDSRRFQEMLESAIEFAKEHHDPDGARLKWSSLLCPVD